MITLREGLLQPSLTKDFKPTKTFKLTNLVWVGLFGGVIPVMIMGKINARWLKVDGKLINGLIAFGVLILVARMIAFGLCATGDYEISSREIRGYYEIVSVAFAVLFVKALSRAYFKHATTGLPVTPMKSYVIKSLAVAILVEGVLIIVIASAVGLW